MKEKFYKSSNGAISVFVLMTMLFFLFAMLGIFSIISKRAQTQTESLESLKNKYYSEGEESKRISNRLADSEDLIPIYTSQQLLSIGTPNKTIEIDGKVYDFSQTDYSKYELKNDIIIDRDLISRTALSDSSYNALNRGNYEILYYDNNNDCYYQIARGNDSAVKDTIQGGFKIALKYIDKDRISADKSTYYGQYVNYQAENSKASNWRILYADNNNIYLIASDYISSEYVPKGKNGSLIAVKDTDYCFSMENVINDYSGADWLFGSITNGDVVTPNSLANGWLNKYYNYTTDGGTTYPGRTSTNPNIEAVSYILDTTAWNKFKGDKADYAIGGPTLELLQKSYNGIHESNHNLDINVKDINGYEIKNSTDNDYVNYIWGYISESERLYVLPPKSQSSKANATWLATPSAAGANNVMYLSCSGSLNSNVLTFHDIGFRPVVCLSSNVVLSRNLDGTYNVK